MTDVVITQSEPIEGAITSALEHLPLASLVTGRRVAVKSNETRASKNDPTGITQPVSVLSYDREYWLPYASSVWLWRRGVDGAARTNPAGASPGTAINADSGAASAALAAAAHARAAHSDRREPLAAAADRADHMRREVL